MPIDDTFFGTLCHFDHPEWEPLEHLVGVELAGWFMWMCEIELSDGTYIQAYKHVSTRRYLQVSDDGRAFTQLGDSRYREIDPLQAIDQAFAEWESLVPEAGVADAAHLARARSRAQPRG